VYFESGRAFDDISDECLRCSPRRPLVPLTHSFNQCLRYSHFPVSWKEEKSGTVLKLGKDPKFLQNFGSISLLFTAGKLCEKPILKTVQRHIQERGLLHYFWTSRKPLA
jgi:hypothetical protein